MPSNFKNKKDIINRINQKLESTSLEFVNFVENEKLPLKKYHIYLKCKKCNQTEKYYLNGILYSKKITKCKICENYNKKENDEVIKIIKEKCKQLDYTFIGFNNELNRYLNKKTKLILKCNKCAYIWNTTRFSTFNSKDIVCRNCTNSWKMEKKVKELLTKMKVKYEEQKRFDWLRNKIPLSLDFYLPDYNIAIECQGLQHFQPIEKYGGIKNYIETIERDTIKNKLCKEKQINLIYFNDEDNVSEFLGEKIIKKINILKKYIYDRKQKN